MHRDVLSVRVVEQDLSVLLGGKFDHKVCPKHLVAREAELPVGGECNLECIVVGTHRDLGDVQVAPRAAVHEPFPYERVERGRDLRAPGHYLHDGEVRPVDLKLDSVPPLLQIRRGAVRQFVIGKCRMRLGVRIVDLKEPPS